MSGSKKWVRYSTDDGQLWALIRDESNTEGAVLADADVDIGTGDSTKYAVPRNVVPRFATYKSDTTVKFRKVTIPTRDLYDDLASDTPVSTSKTFAEDGETFRLQSLTPERIRPVVFSADTGLNEGDAT